MPRKRPTRWDDLQDMAAAQGWIVRRYSPGDGRTRYRFFEKRYVKRRYGAAALRRQTYFGPASGACTVIGLKKAYKFLGTGACS